MIKKIVINAEYKIITIDSLSLIVYQNGKWDKLYPGNTIKSDHNVYETDILNITRSSEHNSEYVYWFLSTKGSSISKDESLTIEFKTPIKVLKSITCNLTSNYAASATIYDENDNNIFKIKYLTAANLTPTLEKIKVYPTNTVGTIVTNDTSHISDVYSISQVTTDETTEDAITDIKYAVSFDGRKTYKAYRNSAWSALLLSNIMTNGMSKTELEALTDSEYDPQLTSDRTFDIVAGMTTNNSEKTPSIKSIIVDYLKISSI